MLLSTEKEAEDMGRGAHSRFSIRPSVRFKLFFGNSYNKAGIFVCSMGNTCEYTLSPSKILCKIDEVELNELQTSLQDSYSRSYSDGLTFGRITFVPSKH